MKTMNIINTLWNESETYARKTAKGLPNFGDCGEWVASKMLNGTALANRNDSGMDLTVNGLTYEVKTTAQNPASFGAKTIGQCYTVKEAVTAYITECEKNNGKNFGGFVVIDNKETLKVMSTSEFTEYASARLVHKRSSKHNKDGSPIYAWKLARNARTVKMNDRMKEEGRV